MKKLQIGFIVFLFAINSFAQTNPCGEVIEDTFDVEGTLPDGWTEYNTSGRVTVESGYVKFNYDANHPSAYRTLATVSNDFSCSFDVEGSRNTMNCQIDLVSSTGKFIASIALGKATSDIKYATSMGTTVPADYIAGVIGTAKFVKETTYSLSMYVDFENQTVDFYNAGVLTLDNIPFLETASDFNKIDVQLLYMYGGSGTTFLDNVKVVEVNAIRLDLTNALTASQAIFNAASVGDGYHEYPQTAVDDFKQVIDAANVVLSNCNALDEAMLAASTDLEAAKAVFLSTQVDPDALTLYSVYNFLGDEKEMKCGYYNGTLGDFDDKPVSFKLDKGYMATFAQDLNGTGVSKVYIASEEDLAINLPAELQKTVSFIRVGPWRDTLKKGSSGKDSSNDVTIALNTSWFYDWGNADASFDSNEYVVMNWGGTPSLGTMANLGNTMDITHHLAFNEPDGSNQANMTVDVAIARYATLQASGLRLGAPAVTDGTKGRAWLDEFMVKAKAAGYRIDFIPVHYYKIMTASNFYTWLKNFYDEYQVPIWVTEFNYGDIWAENEKNKTEAQVLTNITAYCEMMDNADFIERYCIFTWQPSETSAQTVMSVRNPLTLNSVGEYYANHESPIAYTQEVYEQGGLLSVDNNSILSEVSIYPTVVTDGFFSLIYPDEIINSNIELTIYNSAGQLVKKLSNSSTTVDVNKLSSGLYFVKINSDLGYFSEKIIIQ